MGEITVIDLVDKYMNTRRNLKTNSLRAYSSPIASIRNDPFGQRKINTVKLSDAKQYCVQLHDNGYSRNTIAIYQAVLRPSFQLAVDDDAIRKNPFDFTLSDIIPNDAKQRTALTKEQEKQYLDFVESLHGNYLDDIIILFGTGLRVSELYGLTKADVDFSRRCVVVNKQLCRTGDKPYFIDKPKTDSGYRTIPMTDKVHMAFQRVLAARNPQIEYIVDGVSGFVFLDKDDRPKTAMHIENYMRYIQQKFIAEHGKTIPNVTPHVCRHTFCTRCQQSGIDCKSLQFLMGHSNVSVTLDVYSHNDYAHTERAFREIAECI